MKTVALNTIENPGLAIERAEQPAESGVDFTDALKNAVQKVDAIQQDADAEAQKLARGEGNLHETMLALEKADVTMKVAMKVRNKIVEAYNDVMRMGV